MRYRIESIGTIRGTNLLYVDVAFLVEGDNNVVHRNDFVMQIEPTSFRYNRWIDTGKVDDLGEPILEPDINSREEYDTDVRAVILENIARYVARIDVRKVAVDRRDTRIKVEDTDPLGLRAAPGVTKLVGTSEIEISG